LFLGAGAPGNLGDNKKMLKLNIADIVISIRSEKSGLEEEIASQYKGFLAPDEKETDYDLTVNALPREDEVRDIEVKSLADGFQIQGEDFSCRWDRKKREVSAGLYPEATIVNTFLRVLFSVLLAERDGFLIHSAGVVWEGKGCLFVGPSSSGKTTTARMAQEEQKLRVLNDELVAVRKMNDRFYLYATPFKGEHDGPLEAFRAPLEKFFFLKKNQSETYIIVERAQGAVSLLENIFFFAEDEALQARLLSLCCDLAAGTQGFDVDLFRAKSLETLISGSS